MVQIRFDVCCYATKAYRQSKGCDEKVCYHSINTCIDCVKSQVRNQRSWHWGTTPDSGQKLVKVY